MVSVINMFVVSLLSLETSGEEAIRVDRSGRCTLKDAREREILSCGGCPDSAWTIVAPANKTAA